MEVWKLSFSVVWLNKKHPMDVVSSFWTLNFGQEEEVGARSHFKSEFWAEMLN